MSATTREIRRSYFDLLKKFEWFEFRAFALEFHGNKCWLCESIQNLQVHHLGYRDILPWEYAMDEVRIYCQECHEVVTRCVDYLWNQSQKLMPHEIEMLVKNAKEMDEGKNENDYLRSVHDRARRK